VHSSGVSGPASGAKVSLATGAQHRCCQLGHLHLCCSGGWDAAAGATGSTCWQMLRVEAPSLVALIVDALCAARPCLQLRGCWAGRSLCRSLAVRQESAPALPAHTHATDRCFLSLPLCRPHQLRAPPPPQQQQPQVAALPRRHPRSGSSDSWLPSSTRPRSATRWLMLSARSRSVQGEGVSVVAVGG
jgi:hypothetical protein